MRTNFVAKRRTWPNNTTLMWWIFKWWHNLCKFTWIATKYNTSSLDLKDLSTTQVFTPDSCTSCRLWNNTSDSLLRPKCNRLSPGRKTTPGDVSNAESPQEIWPQIFVRRQCMIRSDFFASKKLRSTWWELVGGWDRSTHTGTKTATSMKVESQEILSRFVVSIHSIGKSSIRKSWMCQFTGM